MKNLSNRTKLLLAAAVLLVCAAFQAPGIGGGPDPCNYALRRSAPIPAATSTTTQQLIPAMAGRHIHVCLINATVGSNSTIQFYQNTAGATTGFTQLTGALTTLAGSADTAGSATYLRTVTGNALFYSTTGTGAPGWITYVYENPSGRVVNPTETPWVTATPTQTPTPTPTPT